MSSATTNTAWITKIHQHPERAVPDLAQEFLAQGYVAHVDFQQDGRPYVIPMLYHLRRRTSRPPLPAWRRIEPHAGTSRRWHPNLRDGHATRRPRLFARCQVSLGQLSLRHVFWPRTTAGR